MSSTIRLGPYAVAVPSAARGEPESERLVRLAETQIEALETSARWSAESCDQLREHLYGCDAPGETH